MTCEETLLVKLPGEVPNQTVLVGAVAGSAFAAAAECMMPTPVAQDTVTLVPLL